MTDKDHLPGFKAVCLDNSSSLAQLALIPGGGGRGGGVLNKCLRPEVQPLTLLHIIFHKQGTTFVYVLLTNGTPSLTLFRTFHPF